MKILIADDDPVSRRLLERTLERNGFEVVSVADGEAALASLLAPDGPRLAILDWMMPGADGPSVCRSVRACPGMPYVYILLLTSREAIEDIVEGFDAGADDYLTKPYSPDELKVRLRVGQRSLQLQDELIYEAMHDSLTKLPNRAFFVKSLAGSVNRSQLRPGYRFTLLFIDIDRFKTVNDSVGHLAGDELMRAVAQRLLMAVRTDSAKAPGAAHASRRGLPGDVVARMGGDEFVILLDETADVEDGIRVAERVLKVMSAPFAINGIEILITASIGIASSEGTATAATDILRGADTAMYRAKLLGKARYEVDTTASRATVTKRIRLEADLRRAIDNNEMHVHYQPIVRFRDSAITGFEALARWQHPVLGNIPPDTFIAIAEESGYILAIGSWIMEEACRQIKVWNETSYRTGLKVCVNVSPAQYCQEDLVAHAQGVLQRTGLEPHCLTLEVTENLTMQNVEQAAATLLELQRLGVSVSLDDFGTGYSSLGYLLRFPIHNLKIDRSFVTGIESSSERAAMVKTIITLGHNLGMKIVAEGVENPAQCQLLLKWGCDFGQGYFFSRPVSAADATLLLGKQDMGTIVRSAMVLQAMEQDLASLLN